MQAKDPTLKEQLLDPRVLANFLEALCCLGQVDTEQLSRDRCGDTETGHPRGWEIKVRWEEGLATSEWPLQKAQRDGLTAATA